MAAALPTLIHIHIPKTAGRSLNTLLRAHYPADTQINAVGDTPERKLKAMSPEARARIRLVAGHCRYGVHRLLPHPACYLVLLRAPGPRIFSLYKYIRRTRQHPLHAQLVRDKTSFGAFLELADQRPGLKAELFSGQMRRLAGNMSPTGFGQEEALLQQACAHLSAPNIRVGLTETFDAFLRELRSEGLLPEANDGTAADEQINRAPPGQSYDAAYDQLTPEQKMRITRYCVYDERLMTFATNVISLTHSKTVKGPLS